MATAVEITTHAIRLCRFTQGRMTHLESYPIESGTDPLLALVDAPLPKPLGPVRVCLHHPDLLLRTMVQPACPPERLERIIAFELQSLLGDDHSTLATWHLVRAAGGTDEMRILVQVAKRSLLDELQFALKRHKGRLAGLIHPATGLYQTWWQQATSPTGDAVLLDVGGDNIHMVLVRDGELLFERTNQPGHNAFCKDLAELRNLGNDDARALICKLTDNAPDDITDLITRAGSNLATLITTNCRFAKAQLKLDRFEPSTIHLSGAGARLPSLAKALAARARCPVKLINPFAGHGSGPAERLDAEAELPSPWAPAIGIATARTIDLDVLEPLRPEKQRFWLTHGALRITAAAVVALVLLTAIRQHLGLSSLNATNQELDQLVPRAQKVQKQVNDLRKAKSNDEKRIRFLASVRRPAQVTTEILNAISQSIDARDTRVVVNQLSVARRGDHLEARLIGAAEAGGGRGPDQVLEAFRENLIENYPPIDEKRIGEDPITFDSAGRLRFGWSLTIPDDKLLIAQAP